MRQNKVRESNTQRIERLMKERAAEQFGKELNAFGFKAYCAALKFFADHHRNPRALERFMRRLEA